MNSLIVISVEQIVTSVKQAGKPTDVAHSWRASTDLRQISGARLGERNTSVSHPPQGFGRVDAK